MDKRHRARLPAGSGQEEVMR
uniref:Uncharacterized protein n=1 Tax=Arundo donax TaxID=35708 RepID=A0A0A9B353_ARUDO